MRISPGQNVLITGASGGLGAYLTEAFAQRGVNLALVAFPGIELERLRQNVQARDAKTLALALDLRQSDQRRQAIQRIEKEMGPIDLLINNAGIEFTCPYHELSEENICDVIRVNLEAAMIMTRLILPGMLKRGRGHIVNISSLAGKANPALQEPYAATKAGLIAFTFSLRASYRAQGVSASAIVPGFVETGIYTRLKQNSGCSAPALLGTSSPQKVVQAVMRAVERDSPEAVVSALPVRPLLGLIAMCPSLGLWVLNLTGGHAFFRKAFEATKNKQP